LHYIGAVLRYWGGMLLKALFDSFLLLWESPHLFFIAGAVTIATGGVAWFWLGKQEFITSHWKGVRITLAGGLAAWILFFLVFVVREPPDAQFLVESKLNQSQQREQEALNARTAAEEQLEAAKIEIETARSENARLKQQGGKAAPEIPKHCWSASRAEQPNPQVAGALIANTLVIFCNYRVEAPFLVAVKYDTPNFKNAQVLHMSESSTFGGVGQVKGPVFVGEITGPSLPPNEFLAVTVQGTTSQLPRVLGYTVQSK